MSDSLRDQLLKAGLVSEKQARQAAHAQRVDRKQQGRQGVEAEREQRKHKVEAEQQAKRESDRARESARRERVLDRETENRLRQTIASGRLEKTRGPRRFYFVTRDDRLPCLEVTDDVAQRLERGGAAITESPEGEWSIVDGDTARRVAEIDPAWLRVWNGR